MSIRSFVTLTSVLLMLWLGMAFVHTPLVRSGVDPLGPDAEELSVNEDAEAVDLTVSTSP